jgi:hypothetical protein
MQASVLMADKIIVLSITTITTTTTEDMMLQAVAT